jgi:hypothetical protein
MALLDNAQADGKSRQLYSRFLRCRQLCQILPYNIKIDFLEN